MKAIYKNILESVESEHVNNSTKTKNSRVLIIDGLNTFIRCWSSIPTMNEDGDHVAGVTGVLKSIGYAIRQTQPTRVIVVFDGKGGSANRKKRFSGYKADRDPNKLRVNRQYAEMMNVEDERESMKRQFVWLAEMLHELPVTTMIYDGVEADDVMAYIATQLLKEDEQAVVMSTDKDFLQLVNDKVTVYSPTKKKTYDRKAVFEEYGLYPQNLLLFRTLDGDNSDNIPGVKGCGLKTVLKRFPELSEDRKIEFDEFFDIAETKIKESKLYSDIVANKDVILRNQQLMQLAEPIISTNEKMKILDRFREPNKKFEKMEFFKVGAKYKILQNWSDINDWLKSTFSNIIVK